MSSIVDRMYYDSDKSEESEISEVSEFDIEEEIEVTAEKMAPPEDRFYNKGGSFLLSCAWLFFEFVTLFKDFYDLSFKPTLNVITNGYFKTVVSAMYQDVNDVRKYSSLEQFLCDQYLHPEYKFIVYTHETNCGNLTKTQNIILNNGVEVAKSIGGISYRNTKGSIMVLRASVPGSSTMYDINLKHPHNYMVVGNVVTNYFIAWYLKNTYNITFNSEEDLLNTKLEYMNTSYKLDTVTAPYVIKIQENEIVVEEVIDERDPHRNFVEDVHEEEEYDSYEEEEEEEEEEEVVLANKNSNDEEPVFDNSDSDREHEVHFPCYGDCDKGNDNDVNYNEVNDNSKNDTNQGNMDRKNSETSGASLVASGIQDETPKEASEGTNVKSRRRKGPGRKKQDVHFSIPESATEDDKGTVDERDKVQKSKPPSRSRTSRKMKDTCTCGVCGRECHITELNEYLLCDECT